MDIKDLIDHELIIMELKAQTKHEMILELSQLLYKKNRISSLEGFVHDIYQREYIDSTAIGYKIAIPHAKSSHVIKPSLAFAKSKQGIDCDAMDGDLSHIFFMIAMPQEGINSHLKVLAMISRKLMQEDFRESLIERNQLDEILELIYSIE